MSKMKESAVPGPGVGLSWLDEEVEELREMSQSGYRLLCDRRCFLSFPRLFNLPNVLPL